MSILRWTCLLLFGGVMVLSGSAREFSSLEEAFKADKENQMMRAYLRQRVHAALEERDQRFEALETAEQIVEYQERLRAFFRETINLDSFERGPLNAEVTGRLKRDGYAVEKVIFESLPGFHVTGNLYLPAGKGPFPAILHPCGHTEDGKASGVYQKANLLLVQNGFAVLCYDPIGQGERKQLLDLKTGKALQSSTGEHATLGIAPVLLGRGLASYMIWDGMRAIDYLQSRPEIDPDRIGCTGNSGGGNMTAFLMALDDRIQAAAPGCFMTTTRLKNESPGPGDPEQNLFAQIREGLDHPDFAILRAPKPTLILAATKDFVPIEGTWDAFRQAKRVYTKLGYPERIDLIEAPETHGFSQRLREGAVRFFARWLKGESIEVFETEEVAVEKESDLRCTPAGQVLAMEGERSVFDLNRERADQLSKERAGAWSELDDEGKRQLVRKVTGIRDPNQKMKVTELGLGVDIAAVSASGFHRSVDYLLEPEPGITIPMSRRQWTSAKDALPEEAPVHLFCKEGLFSEMEALTPVLRDTERVLVNLRDSGYSKTKNWRFYGADQWISLMLGTSYLAMRTEDLIAVARYLKAEGEKRPLHLHAEAEFGPVALHAAALEPALFESITLHGGITSWETVIDSRDPVQHLHNVVHGALRHYDLSDLIKLTPQGKFRIGSDGP